MRAKQISNSKKKRVEYKNFAVQVKEFITVQDALGKTRVGVTGKNLVTGEEGNFFLTVPKNEEMAKKYENRPTLEKWSEEFKEFGVKKQVKPGAVMFFKNCIPFNNEDDPMGKHYKATWVDRLGDNPQEVQDCMVSGAMVVDCFYEFEDKLDENGKPDLKEDGSSKKKANLVKGRVYHFGTRPENFIQGVPGDELKTQIAAALASKNNPQLLVRYMNDDDQVCSDTPVSSKTWAQDGNNELVRLPDEQAADLWNDEINKVMIALPDAEYVSIIPAETYNLSTEAIKKGSRAAAFKSCDIACSHYEDGNKLKNMQHCFGKTGTDEFSHILNKVDCVETGNKNDPKKDPTLLGDLQYSTNYAANVAITDELLRPETADQSQEADQESALSDSDNSPS